MQKKYNKLFYCFLVGILFLSINSAYAQKKNVLDSLSKELKSSSIDSSRANLLIEISDYYSDESNYQKSIELKLKALKIYEKLNDANTVGNTLNGIGASYYYMQNWDRAIEYFDKALTVVEKLNNIEDQLRFMNNIGVIYEKQGNYQKALEYNEKTLFLKEQLGDSLSISRTLSNIGSVYYNMKNYESALTYFKKSLAIKRNFTDDKIGMSNILLNTGLAYYQLNNFNTAIEYANEGLKVAEDANSLIQQHTAYTELADIYDAMKMYKQANEYIKIGLNLQDSINQINNAKLIADMDAKYEAEKKDNEIALQQIQIEKQNTEVQLQTTQKIWFAIGLFLALILLLVAYRGIKQKQKANRILAEKNSIIEEKNRDITDSITYASNIQQSILPDEKLIANILPDNFIYFKPKDIVSGDFYWFHEKEDYIFFMAGDCTGHGVPGAFVSLLCNNVLNQVVIEKDYDDPGEILTQVNNQIKNSFKKQEAQFSSSDGMDCSLCVIDKKTKKITYAGAYNQLIYVNNALINEIKADRTPIGGRTEVDYQFTSHTVNTDIGDSIYLFSDGYADQFGGPKGKKFMIKRLKELFLKIHGMTHGEQKILLDKTLTEWKGDNEQVDDILVLGFKL